MSRVAISIPDKMRAVLIHEFRSKTEVGDAPVLRPGRGQVLIRIAAAPINPSDLAFLKGGYGSPKNFPLIPGFEGSGTVVAAGSGFLPRFLLGKRVACATNGAFGGTWAEYLLTPASSCVPLPRHLSFEQGEMAIVNPMTAVV